jgi:hypothetical protein
LPAPRGEEGGASVSSTSSRTFEDVKVGVRCKIAALWIAMLFLLIVWYAWTWLRREGTAARG